MYAQGSKHYYVGEIAETSNKDQVVLLKWVVRNGELTADAHPVNTHAVRLGWIRYPLSSLIDLVSWY